MRILTSRRIRLTLSVLALGYIPLRASRKQPPRDRPPAMGISSERYRRAYGSRVTLRFDALMDSLFGGRRLSDQCQP